ncbi:MAG: aminotransferase class III-fold pyridoxal phosphate-dependent enzyme [Candidatus Omnitrophica bacterium]|nr:aminotransferase class III-fold pyridoxal phosphate-dependent enzyme [Candidatus Omnitrophota bacterium]MDE2008794.1 aminotransferase class III-fold pyridoxal phosphate-dependent enzyme [Candidatus Omnitrophota bacterium]MDE2213643.1 aminotransferase class III-fold pyridoxal phosphate-dependent enzyme [Candidatus Omnitrophota bacterium]MDE2230456.1 aminotransferase class III-fold pyridoxal phosphate-dependent enzyme [Candidatus Omnitrophota bacterium]
MSEEELRALESKYCSWGDTVHRAQHPNIFCDAQGMRLYDARGTEYMDLQMWYSAANFGYKNKRLNDALKKQIDTLPQLACQYLHEEKIMLATKISQDIEKKFGVKGRVHFNVGGAQAVEDALKVVRNYTGKIPVFAFMGSYHGRTFGATAITSSYRYREHYGHFGDRAHFVPYPYRFRCTAVHDKKDCCDLSCLKPFQKMFESEYYSVINTKNNNCEYGAFFVEPVQGTGGYIAPPQNYFKELKKTLDKHNILFVADEIQMGFYRTGKLWSIEHFDVVPDIIIFGKALTNGLNPLSGIWAKEELINPEIFGPGMTHSTFSSNPLGTAAGLAVMDLIEESNFDVTVPQKGAYFLKKLQALQKKYPHIGEVGGLGLALRMEICQKDGFTPNQELTDKIVNIGLKGELTAGGKKRGLVLDVGGYYKNVFTIAPSLYITEEEIDLSLMLFEEALQKALAD